MNSDEIIDLSGSEEIAAALETGATWAETQPEKQYAETAAPLRLLAARILAGEVAPVACEWSADGGWAQAIAIAEAVIARRENPWSE